MIRKYKSNSRKSWLINGDRLKGSWRRNIGKNKKIQMIESKKKIDLQKN